MQKVIELVPIEIIHDICSSLFLTKFFESK